MINLIKMIFLVLLITSLMSVSNADAISGAEEVYANVNQSIFTIFDVNNSDKTKIIGFGSAVAINKTLLATNCHVLKGDQQVVKIGKQTFPSTLVLKDEPSDMCIIKVAGKTFKPVKFRLSTSVKIGEEVYTIGSPKGYEKTISRGIISNEIQYHQAKMLQTDAAISPGSSGGGLFDKKGYLIGIVFLKDKGDGTEGIGFALPTEVITTLLKTQAQVV